MTTFSKRYIVKIPKDICVLYCDKKKLLTLIGFLDKKSLQVKLKVLILKPENFLVITQKPFTQMSSNEKKKNKICTRNNYCINKTNNFRSFFYFF